MKHLGFPFTHLKLRRPAGWLVLVGAVIICGTAWIFLVGGDGAGDEGEGTGEKPKPAPHAYAYYQMHNSEWRRVEVPLTDEDGKVIGKKWVWRRTVSYSGPYCAQLPEALNPVPAKECLAHEEHTAMGDHKNQVEDRDEMPEELRRQIPENPMSDADAPDVFPDYDPKIYWGGQNDDPGFSFWRRRVGRKFGGMERWRAPESDDPQDVQPSKQSTQDEDEHPAESDCEIKKASHCEGCALRRARTNQHPECDIDSRHHFDKCPVCERLRQHDGWPVCDENSKKGSCEICESRRRRKAEEKKRLEEARDSRRKGSDDPMSREDRPDVLPNFDPRISWGHQDREAEQMRTHHLFLEEAGAFAHDAELSGLVGDFCRRWASVPPAEAAESKQCQKEWRGVLDRIHARSSGRRRYGRTVDGLLEAINDSLARCGQPHVDRAFVEQALDVYVADLLVRIAALEERLRAAGVSVSDDPEDTIEDRLRRLEERAAELEKDKAGAMLRGRGDRFLGDGPVPAICGDDITSVEIVCGHVMDVAVAALVRRAVRLGNDGILHLSIARDGSVEHTFGSYVFGADFKTDGKSEAAIKLIGQLAIPVYHLGHGCKIESQGPLEFHLRIAGRRLAEPKSVRGPIDEFNGAFGKLVLIPLDRFEEPLGNSWLGSGRPQAMDLYFPGGAELRIQRRLRLFLGHEGTDYADLVGDDAKEQDGRSRDDAQKILSVRRSPMASAFRHSYDKGDFDAIPTGRLSVLGHNVVIVDLVRSGGNGMLAAAVSGALPGVTSGATNAVAPSSDAARAGASATATPAAEPAASGFDHRAADASGRASYQGTRP